MPYNNIKPGGGDTGAVLNLKKRISLIQRTLNIGGKKFIDCGCGTGQYLLAILDQGADVYGIEDNIDKVNKFKQEHPDIAERVRNGNIEAMEFEAETFDFALLNEVLEHVPNETKALKDIYRVLKPDGIVIIFSPNRFYPFETHSVYLHHSNRKLPITFPFIPYIPLGLGNKLFRYDARNYWPHELRKQVCSCGFKIIETSYIWQTFENISGGQPKFVTFFKPALRKLFTYLEQVPVVKVLGVSQLLIAQKIPLI
jgi:ubiquinone/menaquinone biosynthesis C-methylase UbiE